MKNTFGFSLLEVLIATSILTFGILGVAGLYISSLKRAENAYCQVLATSQWVFMVEQQKAGDSNCQEWQAECKKILPHGEGKSDSGIIGVCWNGKSGRRCL